ncbi:unnamed protein product (macronuclear) [Paramecium tetraurelia]|uniref:Protein kinase domain-containing protein n=1 Tax=Paramecium tetraurelia TaxID=5888 RepID=A0CN31_PARTE|nr:uncharacterized protein GSPATT00008639001 [Paramecium tetraurelia]CAK72198.1 unnamed protein product [Paramecium tetraurelia]|eukprot:XP_001439595.1 hypothetical protein (macronuclear) [Paramecium tetraurelia strain d4-2]
MGGCVGKPQKRSKKPYVLPKTLEQQFNTIEIDLLYLIYQDLASRNVENLVNKTAFTDFFTMIGLWGELVFDYFNQENHSLLNFEQFLKGVVHYIKCDEDQKIQHLFKLYDLDKQGLIRKSEFLQMIQNYPRDDLIKLLDDPMFLEDLKILKYYETKEMINQKKNQPKRADEQEFTESVHAIQRKNSMSGEMQSIQGAQSGESAIGSQSNLPAFNEQSVVMMFPNESMIGPTGVPMGQFGQNITFNINGKLVELKRVNINYLVHKYVNMIYKHKAKNDQGLSLEDFKSFVKLHPKIFEGLYKAFNFDVWGFDTIASVPRMMMTPKDLEGEVKKITKKNPKVSNPRYFKLMQRFCLSFKTKDSTLPSRIFCLDGLTIQEKVNNQEQQYGFEVSHKDKLYQTRTYMCGLTVYKCFKTSVNDYYSILQKIGEGKFSIVYLCECKKDRQTLAIKIIEKFKLSKSEKLMLAHEVEIMKLLNHSCIVRFHEIIETKTHLNIITEVVRDGDLFDYIIKNENINEQEASLIMSQLFDTLNYIHSVGIVHRDLKPENIMIVLDATKKNVKQVKIIDFGFANFLTNIQTKEGEALCGTTNYLAPESLEQKKIDFKVDNFALGVILYFLLSGYLPFDSEFPEDIIKNIIECKYDLQEEFWQQISDDARDLIKKLLMKEPDERISMQSALEHPWIKNRNQLPTKKAQRVKNRLGLF